MLNSAVSLLPILGGVGVGIAAPMIYEGVAVKNFQTSWKRRLDKSPYLLGSCKKQLNSNDYNVKLFLAEDDSGGGEEEGYNRGSGLTVFVTANDGEKLFGGWSLKGDSSSNIAQLSIKPQIITNKEERQDFWDDIKDCPIENIVVLESSSSREIESHDVKFECEAKKYGFGKKECDVRFSKENNLTFKEGFQPKLRFLAF